MNDYVLAKYIFKSAFTCSFEADLSLTERGKYYSEATVDSYLIIYIYLLVFFFFLKLLTSS